jgi:predicted ester cyclase
MVEHEFNKQRLRELLAAVDAGELDRALEFYAPDYVDHDSSESRRGDGDPIAVLRAAFARFRFAFGDVRHVIDDLVAEGDRVAARLRIEATHIGEIFGMPASGRRVSNDSIVIYRFASGRIVERWCRERRSTRAAMEEASNS